MIGCSFGKLTVLNYVGVDKNNHKLYYCRCECGNIKTIRGTGLKNSGTKSCGCLIRETLSKRNYRHGNHSRSHRSSEYISWSAMVQRCTNPKHRYYHRYGGRGISICNRWLKFKNFLNDMGLRPVGCSLGRKENNQGYKPSNCAWMNVEEQSLDRITSKKVTINGVTCTIKGWCKRRKIRSGTVYARCRRGWDLIKAINTPASLLEPTMAKLSKEEMSRIGKSNVRRGKSHERRVANLLSEWSKTQFRRRRVEGRDSNVIERESTADVIPVIGDIHFSIEAKCGILTSLDGLLADPINNMFTRHWHQACYDAQLVTKAFNRRIYPLLFFKPHTNFDWIAVAQEPFLNGVLMPSGKSTLNNQNGCWFPAFAFDIYKLLGEVSHNISHTRNKKNHIKVPLSLEPLFICRWKDFATYVDPCSFYSSFPLPKQLLFIMHYLKQECPHIECHGASGWGDTADAIWITGLSQRCLEKDLASGKSYDPIHITLNEDKIVVTAKNHNKSFILDENVETCKIIATYIYDILCEKNNGL